MDQNSGYGKTLKIGGLIRSKSKLQDSSSLLLLLLASCSTSDHIWKTVIFLSSVLEINCGQKLYLLDLRLESRNLASFQEVLTSHRFYGNTCTYNWVSIAHCRRQRIWSSCSLKWFFQTLHRSLVSVWVYRFLEDNEKYNGIENGMQVRTFRSLSRPFEIWFLRPAVLRKLIS